MKIAITFLAVFAAVAGIRGAYLWYLATKVPILPAWAQKGPYGQTGHSHSPEEWIAAITQAIERSGQLNKTASRWTAISVTLSVIATCLGTWFLGSG